MINFNTDYCEADEPTVQLTIPIKSAQILSDSLSDFLCWSRGYCAATPDNVDRHPMGIGDIRDFRIELDRQIKKVESK